MIMVSFLVLGQAVASKTFFQQYNLLPIAAYVESHQDHSWAFVRNYHGEIGFLSKLQKPIADRQLAEIDAWFQENPDGMAIIRYKNENEVSKYTKVMTQSYRGKNLGIFLKN